MKLSDYVMNFIADLGVDRVFCVTGGGAMHLNNSLGENDRLQGVFMIHEQGASIAAEAYARIREGFGVCLVTSGPGATNALTGLCGAYMDSIPVIFISGQAKRADLVGDQQIRQFGIQEVDIISMARPYTKYAVQIQDPGDIRYELEKAAHIASGGRPGAVWIDIPLDIQASLIEPDDLAGYEEEPEIYAPDKADMDTLIEKFNEAKRPAVILGNGVRLSHAVSDARELIDILKAPVFTSWNGVDLIEEDHPYYYGRPNIVGHRAANLILQNADFVLSVGTRLSLLNTGYNFEGYLSRAYHVMVDIDEHEMEKKSLHPNLKIRSDAGIFIREMIAGKDRIKDKDRSSWIRHCDSVRERYPVRIPEQEPRKGYVDLYRLFDILSGLMTPDDIYQFTSSGTTVDIGMKMLRLKKGQRAFLNKSMAAMGYDIPASVGSCIGSGGKRTVCVTGDGSAAMNLQELEVVHRLQLPVKLFIADNQGYSMIWHSQSGNFKGHLTGCTKESGLSLPDMERVAAAFGIHAITVRDNDELGRAVEETLSFDGPAVCVVKSDIQQKVLPKQSNYVNDKGQMESRPMEDMVPLLDREELKGLMSDEI
ncbi:MAG: thiamine pyrophosphate-binding protein [Lachnospiraceae bacterium]|nr:thiamine pyrophosphate-binding protein [Lachnospiraceae bacterium]